MVSNTTPANDAHLVQLVRGHLGKRNQLLTEKINVSSCKFTVTLHGPVPNPETRKAVENAVREVFGVRGVVNKLRGVQDRGASVFPAASFGVSDLVQYPKAEVPE